KPCHSCLFHANGAHGTARHRVRDDLPVDDHRESDRCADCRAPRSCRGEWLNDRNGVIDGPVADRSSVLGAWDAMKKQPPENSASPPQLVSFDAIMPAAMAVRAEESGIKRASTDATTLFVLSVLAGAFISFGAIFATTVSAGTVDMPYGVVRLLTGLVF